MQNMRELMEYYFLMVIIHVLIIMSKLGLTESFTL